MTFRSISRGWLPPLLWAALLVWGSPVSAQEGVEEGEEQDQHQVYIASTQSRKFHLSSCEWIKKIDEENRVTLNSLEEARQQEYRPCEICRPDAELPSQDENRSSIQPAPAGITPHLPPIENPETTE